MSKIQLIVTADEPALFFETVEYAERYLEAIDVEDGVFGAVKRRAVQHKNRWQARVHQQNGRRP